MMSIFDKDNHHKGPYIAMQGSKGSVFMGARATPMRQLLLPYADGQEQQMGSSLAPPLTVSALCWY